jgi:PPOX class probable F420-dependent enzyme
MKDETLHQFADQQYLNRETYRINGAPVATPMWCAEHRGMLSVYARAEAGKVTRLRRDPRVRVVPCTARGTPRGTWVHGTAHLIEEPEATLAHQWLTATYGWVKRLGDLISQVRTTTRVVIAIKVGAVTL